jgi:hypothetical protein
MVEATEARNCLQSCLEVVGLKPDPHVDSLILLSNLITQTITA